MHLARVIGTLVATVKTPGLEGIKLLIVQPLSRDLEPTGKPGVAADAVAMAGPGDLVQIVASREAAVALPQPFVPVDLAILGIVDQVDSASLRGRARNAPPSVTAAAAPPGAPPSPNLALPGKTKAAKPAIASRRAARPPRGGSRR